MQKQHSIASSSLRAVSHAIADYVEPIPDDVDCSEYTYRKRDDLSERSVRIVLAEDDPNVRTITIRLLENLGYQVDAYVSGLDALVALTNKDRPVELLLTDYDMPGLTGYELSRQLRILRPEVKVLLTSGIPEERLTLEKLPIDWPPFIEKPFTSHDLNDKLREVLNGSPLPSEK